LLISRDVTGKYEGGGGSSLGWGVPGGGASAPIRPPVSMPQIAPAYRSPVSVPRSVNAPLNNVQIRQSSGVNVGGGMQIAKPVKPQSKKPVYGPPLPTKAQLQVMKVKSRQKTKAVSVPFGPNHNSQGGGQPWDNSLGNASGAENNILPSELKKRKPEHPAICKLTVSSEYTMTTQQGQFDQNGKAIIEPVAENHLKLRGKIETNRIGAKLSFKLEIGNTDVGVVSSPTVRNVGNINYVSYTLNGVKSIPSVMLTPTILKRNKVSFENYVYSNINLLPGVVSAECVIDGKRVGADILQDSKIFQNGKRVQ
jgi:hypothetical protein